MCCYIPSILWSKRADWSTINPFTPRLCICNTNYNFHFNLSVGKTEFWKSVPVGTYSYLFKVLLASLFNMHVATYAWWWFIFLMLALGYLSAECLLQRRHCGLSTRHLMDAFIFTMLTQSKAAGKNQMISSLQRRQKMTIDDHKHGH